MEDAPGKIEFMGRIRQSRAKWDALVKGLTPSELTLLGVSGDWSVKDIIAHISWHEREMFSVIVQRKLAGSDLWDLPLDQRNKIIYEENKNRDLKDVLDDSSAVFASLMEVMQTLTDDDLQDPSHFAEMPSDWKPWELFAGNTYEHYDDHFTDVQTWLKEVGRPG
jgi:Protein of unknown function (DUF1706)